MTGYTRYDHGQRQPALGVDEPGSVVLATMLTPDRNAWRVFRLTRQERIVQNGRQHSGTQNHHHQPEKLTRQRLRFDRSSLQKLVIRRPVLLAADHADGLGNPAFLRHQASAEQLNESQATA